MENSWISLDLGGAIKRMARDANMTQKSLSDAAGYKSVSSVQLPISRGNMKVNTLLRLTEAAGFDLVLVRRENLNNSQPIRICPNKEGSAVGPEGSEAGPEGSAGVD